MSLSKKGRSQEPTDDGRTPGCSNCPVQIRLKLLDNLKIASHGIPVTFTTTKDDLYMHCSRRGEFIDVYDRNNLREVKHVIDVEALGLFPLAMEACSLSNCLYMLNVGRQNVDVNSIVRMTKNHEDQFDFSPLIHGLSNKIERLFISANGSIIISKAERPNELISIYNPDGLLQHQIKLSLGLFNVSRIIPKPSGNFVLVSYNYEFKRKLTEIDMDGNVVHQHQSSLLGCDVESADDSGRILIVDRNNGIELLDNSDLHLLDVALPEEPDNIWAHPRYLHFDRLRNEVLMIDYTSWFGQDGTISVFAFTEDE